MAAPNSVYPHVPHPNAAVGGSASSNLSFPNKSDFPGAHLSHSSGGASFEANSSNSDSSPLENYEQKAHELVQLLAGQIREVEIRRQYSSLRYTAEKLLTLRQTGYSDRKWLQGTAVPLAVAMYHCLRLETLEHFVAQVEHSLHANGSYPAAVWAAQGKHNFSLRVFAVLGIRYETLDKRAEARLLEQKYARIFQTARPVIEQLSQADRAEAQTKVAKAGEVIHRTIALLEKFDYFRD